MRSTLRGIYAALLFTSLLLPFDNMVLAKSRAPIKVGVSDQVRQQIMVQITGRALVKAGYKVDFVKLDANADGAARLEKIASGSVHVQPVFSVADVEDDLAKALADKQVLSLGGLTKNRKDEPALKIVSPIMKRKWPGAVKMLTTMIFPSEELDRLAQAVDAGNSTMDQIVDDWMKDNQPRWKRWITASKNWMTP